MRTDVPTADADTATLLTGTAAFAATAPTVHGGRPWRWRVSGPVLDLLLERGAAGPHPRPAVLSCGAALHHAVVHLAANGWRAGVRRMPGPYPDHLARLELTGRVPVEPEAARLAAAADGCRTDRRALPTAPLDMARLHPILLAARRQGADLRLLRTNQVFALAAACDAARAAEGRGRAGEFDGATLIAESHEHGVVFAVLYGDGDGRADWLRAGEALSAAWLTATCVDVTVLPFSAVIEQAASREAVRRLLGRPGHPYLVVRFAAAETMEQFSRGGSRPG